jgi:LCP family protein required for cell wall assembly
MTKLHASPPRDPRKKSSAWLRPLIVLLALLLVASIPFGFLTFYLNKINRNTPQKSVDPNADPLDKSGYADLFRRADEDIRANIADGVMWYHKDVYNVLLAGLDYGGNEGFKNQFHPRSDALILASVNRQRRSVTFVSLSRATYVAIPGFENGRINLSHAYGGPALLVKTVELNYKTRIDHFMTVDFDGFQTLVDIMGGVPVTLDEKEYAALDPLLGLKEGPGSYQFNGSEALAYARLRYIDSDRKRTQRQRNLLEQLARKAVHLSFGQMNNCVNGILPLVTTDMSNFDILRCARYIGFGREETIIPRKATELSAVNGQEVLILNWLNVRKDVHDLLYPGLIPESVKIEDLRN